MPEQTKTRSHQSESFNWNLMPTQEQTLGDVVRRCGVRYHSGLQERNDAWRIGSGCVRRSSRKRHAKTSERGHTAYSVVPSYRLRDMLARRSTACTSQDDCDGGRGTGRKASGCVPNRRPHRGLILDRDPHAAIHATINAARGSVRAG